MAWLISLFQDQEAATAVEYAVMLALIIVVCFVAIGALGTQNAALWSDNNGQISAALNAGS